MYVRRHMLMWRLEADVAFSSGTPHLIFFFFFFEELSLFEPFQFDN